MLNFKEPQTVSELTRNIKFLLQENFPFVYIVGEISNLKVQQPRMHCYFTLKDEEAGISAVIWGSKYLTLNTKPEDGMKVLVKGKLTVYEPRGTYQIDVFEIIPTGIGELQAAIEKLKKKLLEEGLFDASKKRHLPRFPMKVGIITSETGAVIKDFKSVTSSRFPLSEIYLFPAIMQGENSAKSVIQQLKNANKIDYGLEVIVIARGGGSLEDLMPFNNEALAREVAASKVPVVSAIGHETDTTICDWAADRRAPTPSAAAEIIFPDKVELLESLNRFEYNMQSTIKKYLDSKKEKLKHFESSYVIKKQVDILNQYKVRLDEFETKIILSVTRKIKFDKERLYHRERLLASFNIRKKIQDSINKLNDMEKAAMNKVLRRINDLKENLDNKENLINSLSPEQTLKRGYVYIKKNGKLISRKAQVKENEVVDMRFYDGEAKAVIKNKDYIPSGPLFDE